MTTVIMPMAGLGSRFAAEGYSNPKPLIEVHSMPMFRLALASIKHVLPKVSAVCITLADHERDFGIRSAIAASEPGISDVTVPALTGGALETCLAAESAIADLSQPLVVLDCDLTFDAPGYIDLLIGMADGTVSADGILLSFRSRNPRYSYAEVLPDSDQVLRTAEKQPISDRALIGAYGFARGDRFFSLARHIVASNHRTGGGEFYVSSAYNALLEGGGSVRIADAVSYWSMGTPAELSACLADPQFTKHLATLKQTACGAIP